MTGSPRGTPRRIPLPRLAEAAALDEARERLWLESWTAMLRRAIERPLAAHQAG